MNHNNLTEIITYNFQAYIDRYFDSLSKPDIDRMSVESLKKESVHFYLCMFDNGLFPGIDLGEDDWFWETAIKVVDELASNHDWELELNTLRES